MEISAAEIHAQTHERIASVKHTVIMIAILLAFSLSGLLSNTSADDTLSGTARIMLYLATLAGEWALVFYVWAGIRRKKKISLGKLITGRDGTGFRFMDAVKGAAFWIIAGAVLYFVKFLLGLPVIANSNRYLLPQNGLEYAVFFVLALSAGFCEEIVYRGYFQQQFSAIFQSRGTAILLQGILFGFSHGYQGVKYMILISVFGVLFGLAAHCFKNLKPGMIAHAWEDVFSGIIVPGW